MVYQRSKNIGGVRPFGSFEKFYENDFVWLNHSISPTHIKDDDFRTKVGLGKNSYSMSVLNISGTSFGAISPPAITSLNKAAKMGGFAHNTGEGSFILITKMVKVIQYGKFQQDILVAEIKMEISILKHSLKNQKEIK